MPSRTTKPLLVTRPGHEIVVRYLAVWSESVVEDARTRGIDIHDLNSDKATKKNFASYIKKHNYGLIFLNGHGNTELITGHDNEPIIDKNCVLKDAVIFARSCDAAQVLGPALVANGAKTFIGYNRKFMLVYNPDDEHHPLRDKMAELFLAPSNSVVSVLLKGHTAEDAHRRSKKTMYKNFRKMLASTATFEERYAARWMWSNLNSQVLIGEQGARL